MHGQTAVKSIFPMGQHQTVLPTTIVGKLLKVGYYRDTLPLLLIAFRKEEAVSIPYKIGERVSVPLVANGITYIAGVRATANSSTINICSDLLDDNHNTVRLVDILCGMGRTHKDSRIEVRIEQDWDLSFLIL